MREVWDLTSEVLILRSQATPARSAALGQRGMWGQPRTVQRAVRVGGAVATYFVGVGFAYELSRPKPPLPSACKRCQTFQCMAPRYDAEIEADEATSGIIDLRRELASHASGSVLEVAGGTGRNIPFYSLGDVKELLLGDFSEEMLKTAATKVAKLRQAQHPVPEDVKLAVLDAANMPFANETFDTVVDTFGLCSFEEPAAALREMARCCKPGGSILLLEHGKSDWTLLAWWQQHRLNRHVVKWGCYWNRDILELVRESGLVITELKRKHMGTTYLIRCERSANHGRSAAALVAAAH